MASRSRWLLFLVLAHMALASGQIKLFINKLPDYSSIAACAEFQLSTIVRNMEDGCGDGSKTTSYNCFCHTSSSYFSSLISYKVEKACATDNPDRQRSSAVGLFETYCHMGDSLTSVVSSTSSPASSTSSSVSPDVSAESDSMITSSIALASPASTPHIASASASPMPSSSSTMEPAKDTPSSKKTSPGVIAAAVVVPIVVIAALAAVILFRKIKHRSPKAPVATDHFTKEEDHGLGPEAREVRSTHPKYTGQSQVYELIQDTAPLRPVEIGGSVAIHEMHQPANELPAPYSRL